jgi:hypothetical protein
VSRAHDFDHHEQQEHEDAGGRQRLVFAVPVRMIFIRRFTRGAQPDQADDIRRAVGEGMKAVGNDADRSAGVAKHQFGAGDANVEDQDSKEDARDLLVAL